MLSILQFFNLVIPLFSVPHLMKVLTPELYGLVSFSVGMCSMFLILIDFGFNFSATRDISKNDKSKEKVIEIFSTALVIKFFLFLISIPILLTLVYFNSKLYLNWKLHFITFSNVIGLVFYPIFVFQGLGKIRIIVYLNLIIKSISTLAIVFFINEKSDYILFPIINSLSNLLLAILSMLYLYTIGYYFKFNCVNNIKKSFINSLNIFLSNIVTSVYTSSTTFFLGFLTSNVNVGYFSAAEKFIQVLKAIFSPLSQALFPFFSKKIDDLKGFRKNIVSISVVFVILTLPPCILINFYSYEIINRLIGPDYLYSSRILKIMSFIPVFVSISNAFSILGLINLGREFLIMRYTFLIAIFHSLHFYLFTINYGVLGSGASLLFTEFSISIGSVYNFFKYTKYTNEVENT